MEEMMQGVYTALVTPFRGDGIDWDSLGDLIDAQVEAGVHGLVPCGTTGESPTLSPEEHDEVVKFVVDRTRGRVPILAGTGSNSTAEAVHYTTHARECGADAALVVVPYYNQPTPAGVIEHYRRVAAVGLPVVVYNIPGRTGVGLSIETYRALASIPGIVAAKEASGSLAMVDSLLGETKLAVFSGDDALTFPFLCLGAHGVISVASNVVPRAIVDLCDYMAEGKLAVAREQHRKLLPLMTALFLETNPAPVKAALASLGKMEEIVRPPLAPLRPETRAALERALAASEDLLVD